MEITNTAMQKLYEYTKEFNTISGAINEVSLKAMKEQYQYIEEEVEELNAALHDNNLTEILDATIDTIITTFGMLQKLKTLGIDVDSAAIETAQNNLSKYPVASAVAQETVERQQRLGIVVTSKFNEKLNRYVLRNAVTGKVVKPYNFKSNDLSKYITKEALKNYE